MGELACEHERQLGKKLNHQTERARTLVRRLSVILVIHSETEHQRTHVLSIDLFRAIRSLSWLNLFYS